MITATITADKYAIKKCHLMKSMSTIRLIVPYNWDCDMVNVVLWEKDCELKIPDPESYEFHIPECGEILLKKVVHDEKRQFVYIPSHYDGQQVLIVPV